MVDDVLGSFATGLAFVAGPRGAEAAAASCAGGQETRNERGKDCPPALPRRGCCWDQVWAMVSELRVFRRATGESDLVHLQAIVSLGRDRNMMWTQQKGVATGCASRAKLHMNVMCAPAVAH